MQSNDKTHPHLLHSRSSAPLVHSTRLSTHFLYVHERERRGFRGQEVLLCLNKGWSGKTYICKGMEYTMIENMREGGEYGRLVDKVDFSHRVD